MAEVKEKKSKVAKIDITKKEPIDKEQKKSVSDVKEVKKENKTAKKIRNIRKNMIENEGVKQTVEKMKKYNITAVVMIALAVFIFSFIISAQLNTVSNTDIISKGMREAELLTELQKAKEQYETLKESYEESQKIV